jgi:hypothetical protein
MSWWPKPYEGEAGIEIRQVFEAEDFGSESTSALKEAVGASTHADRCKEVVARESGMLAAK